MVFFSLFLFQNISSFFRSYVSLVGAAWLIWNCQREQAVTDKRINIILFEICSVLKPEMLINSFILAGSRHVFRITYLSTGWSLSGRNLVTAWSLPGRYIFITSRWTSKNNCRVVRDVRAERAQNWMLSFPYHFS